MKFASLITFQYNKKSREVLVVHHNEKKDVLYGIELANINRKLKDLVLKLYNNEIFRNRMYDEELVKLARQRDDAIQDRELAEDIFIGTGLINTIKSVRIKNLRSTTMIMLLRRQFRTFNMKKVKEIKYVDTSN